MFRPTKRHFIIDKWTSGECFNFAEKCSVSIKVGLGLNGNSVNVKEKKRFNFAEERKVLQAACNIVAAIKGAPSAKSPRLSVTRIVITSLPPA